jgi:hypothetical protein
MLSTMASVSPTAVRGLAAHGAHGLERDPLAALAIVGFVDHAHAAGAEPAPDLEPLTELVGPAVLDVAPLCHPRASSPG